MIRVYIRTDVETEDIVFKAKGHAMSAPKGEDLVCAAASAYVNQLCETVKAIDRQGWLIKKPKIHVEDGKASIVYHPKEACRAIVEYLTMMTTTGFDWLEKEYPEHVKLN